MASFRERFRNLYRDEMVLPKPETLASRVQPEDVLLEAGRVEGYKVGMKAVVDELSVYTINTQSFLAANWERAVADDYVSQRNGQENTVPQINAQYTAQLKEVNDVARFISDFSEEHQVPLDYLVHEVNIPQLTKDVHREARESFSDHMEANREHSGLGFDAYRQSLGRGPAHGLSEEVSSQRELRQVAFTALPAEYQGPVKELTQQANPQHRSVPGTSLHDVWTERLGAEWTIALQGDPSRNESLAVRYQAEISHLNRSLSPNDKPLSFDHIQRRVVGDLETNVHEMANDFTGRDREDFLDRYSHILDAKEPEAVHRNELPPQRESPKAAFMALTPDELTREDTHMYNRLSGPKELDMYSEISL